MHPDPTEVGESTQQPISEQMHQVKDTHREGYAKEWCIKRCNVTETKQSGKQYKVYWGRNEEKEKENDIENSYCHALVGRGSETQ